MMSYDDVFEEERRLIHSQRKSSMSDEQVVHVVVAYAGAWDEKSSYTVCAYFDKALADQHAARASQEAKRIYDANKHLRSNGDTAGTGLGRKHVY